MNYKLTISFDGSKYSGWQFQKNAETVQGTLTDCISRFFSAPVSVTGCSRTDSGVHAENYVCNVEAPSFIDPNGIIKGLNTVLPGDIAVKSCEVARDDFHARYDCKGKEYHYLIHNALARNPFLFSRAYHFPSPLDAEKMAVDAKALIGTHDFTSFMASGSKITDAVRTIYTADVKKEGDIITFSVSANGFLYNMVRIIVGTLIDLNLNRNKMSMLEIIEAKSRKSAGFTAPPEGLYLFRVDY